MRFPHDADISPFLELSVSCVDLSFGPWSYFLFWSVDNEVSVCVCVEKKSWFFYLLSWVWNTRLTVLFSFIVLKIWIHCLWPTASDEKPTINFLGCSAGQNRMLTIYVQGPWFHTQHPEPLKVSLLLCISTERLHAFGCVLFNPHAVFSFLYLYLPLYGFLDLWLDVC